MPATETTYTIHARPMTQFRALPGASAVDVEAGIISGVSVMTIGPALGHGLTIDAKGLQQCLDACLTYGDEGVKLVVNHDSGFSEIVGVVKNFRIEGEQLLGDAHLLESAPQRAHVLEVARKLPKNFGLSVETFGEHEAIPNAKGKLYRCAEIDAIALVPKPAANKTGIFSAVDTPPKANMDPEEIKTIVGEAVAGAIAPIDERLKKLEKPEEKPKEDLAEEEAKEEEKLSKLIEKASASAVEKFAASIGVKRPPASAADATARKGMTAFEVKVEEATKAGDRNPFSSTALKHPALYNEFRANQEKR